MSEEFLGAVVVGCAVSDGAGQSGDGLKKDILISLNGIGHKLHTREETAPVLASSSSTQTWSAAHGGNDEG